MDRLVKALYMADEFRCMVVSTPFLIWKNQNIKCQLKVNLKSKLKNLNIKSLDSMLEEKLRKKLKKKNPQLINYFRNWSCDGNGVVRPLLESEI